MPSDTEQQAKNKRRERTRISLDFIFILKASTENKIFLLKFLFQYNEDNKTIERNKNKKKRGGIKDKIDSCVLEVMICMSCIFPWDQRGVEKSII